MEELISCLVLSSPPRLILPSQVPELSPTTLLICLLSMWNRVFIMTLNTLLVCAWARSMPALTFSWRLHVSGQCYAPSTAYSLPCNTCAVTLGIWVMNVPIMPLHLVHLALFPVTTLPLAGFVITLTSLPVLVTNSISEVLENCVASEVKQHHYLRMGVSVVFLIGLFVTLTHAFVSLLFLLSGLFPARSFRRSNGKPNFVCLYRVELW